MDLALESCVDARLKTRENRKKQTHQTHGTLLAVACSIPNALDCIKVNGKTFYFSAVLVRFAVSSIPKRSILIRPGRGDIVKTAQYPYETDPERRYLDFDRVVRDYFTGQFSVT